MLGDLHKRAKHAGKPPGTLDLQIKNSTSKTKVTVVNYTAAYCHKWVGTNWEACPLIDAQEGTTWINIEGLEEADLILKLAARYKLHPLTVEDIANMAQRPKVEEFDHYDYITLKIIEKQAGFAHFKVEQLSLVLGNNFVLSFFKNESPLLHHIYERLDGGPNQRLRQHPGDYLVYRILDTVVDYYFVVLEALGNLIDLLEEDIIENPKPKNTKTIYRLKKRMMILRKAIWPAREVISHLQQVDEAMVTPFTRVYLRDLYDHIVLAIDTVETFRDLLSNMLDIYLSSMTNRMNEVMKTLTIIATIFIPMTFVASVYGMNFINMPELAWHYGYYFTLGIMSAIAIGMLIYFRVKKWL